MIHRTRCVGVNMVVSTANCEVRRVQHGRDVYMEVCRCVYCVCIRLFTRGTQVCVCLCTRMRTQPHVGTHAHRTNRPTSRQTLTLTAPILSKTNSTTPKTCPKPRTILMSTCPVSEPTQPTNQPVVLSRSYRLVSRKIDQTRPVTILNESGCRSRVRDGTKIDAC